MSIEKTSIQPQFICPYCQSPLIPDSKTWRCDGSLNDKHIQHPFDVAKQGYVNLLPVQNKKSKDPGDSKASIEARYRFLAQKFYQPLQQLVARLVGKIITTISEGSGRDSNSNQSNKVWLDIGCGEGYYTQAMAQSLKTPSVLSVNSLVAVDISKPAIIQLSKTAKQNGCLWSQIEASSQNVNSAMDKGMMIDALTALPAMYPMVASASHLPLVDSSVDGISSIFSPILPKEFARVLQDKGSLIIVKPDVGHLQTVRDALFDEVRPHDSDKFLDELTPYFRLVDTHFVQAQLTLNEHALADLLTMTPYSYRARAEKREALLALAQTETFKTEARFVVYELVKT